jgi:hypothetical protein
MNISELLRWQFTGYEKFHKSHANLLIHIVVVPLFLLGNIGLVAALATSSWIAAASALAAMIVSVALQGHGHGLERNPPEPFTGAANAVARIFLEQWVTFPRFVVTGAWLRALLASATARRTEARS